MKRLLPMLLTISMGVPTAMGQGSVSIPPIYVAGYARDFLLPVDNGLYYGALYGVVSNSPLPSLTPIYPNTVLNYNWDGIEVLGSHLTFPNPLTLGFPSGTQIFLQAQVWVGSPTGPWSTHYNSPVMLVTLDGTSPPAVNFGTVIVPLIPEPTAPLLLVTGFCVILHKLRSRKFVA